MENRLAGNARTMITKRSTNTREEKFEVGVGCGGFRVECTKQNRAREGGDGKNRKLEVYQQRDYTA